MDSISPHFLSRVLHHDSAFRRRQVSPQCFSQSRNSHSEHLIREASTHGTTIITVSLCVCKTRGQARNTGTFNNLSLNFAFNALVNRSAGLRLPLTDKIFT